jgi:hypothetical protein
MQLGLISVAAVVLGFAIIEVVSIPPTLSGVGVIVASVFVSNILSRYYPRIAGTDFRKTIKKNF